MKKLIKGLLIMMAICLTLFCSCGKKSTDDDKTTATSNEIISVESNENDSKTYDTISAEDAKKLIDTQESYIIIDARTTDEFNEGHIENAILIPEYEIAERAALELPDKNQLILVYCRSGRRSKIAAEALAEMGYTNVKDFGGIINWPYETVK